MSFFKIISLIVIFLISWNVVKSQSESIQTDSLRANLILNKYNIHSDSTSNVNSNNAKLNIDKKLISKLVKLYLFQIYGRGTIKKQRPYQYYFLDNHWIVEGSMKARNNGGTFILIINSLNGRVELLSHGK